MSKINRSAGTNESERYLAKLAEKNFLSLWSYPNTFNSEGKEHADLLVVCGDDVIVFSDKLVKWPGGQSEAVQWKRWFDRAVAHSVRQIRGAVRWLRVFPNKIFLDRELTQPLPARLPPPERLRVHAVAVAKGAKEACISHFGGGSGALAVVPSIVGGMHTDSEAPSFQPFAIGDVDPEESYVHVLDEVSLEIVLTEVDTVADFVAYLVKKETFVRSGQLLQADDEADLIAYYQTHMNGNNEHDFVQDDGGRFPEDAGVVIQPSYHRWLSENPRYLLKKEADRVSYAWDALIERFAGHVLGGTLANLGEGTWPVSDIEYALRFMALLPRYQRRAMGSLFVDVLLQGTHHHRIARLAFDARGGKTAFAFITLKVSKVYGGPAGYDEYRQERRALGYGYALKALKEHPEIDRIVIVALEPRPAEGDPPGSSEDLIMLEQPTWTPEKLAELAELEEAFGGLLPRDRVVRSVHSGTEFPEDVPVATREGTN